MTALEQRTNAQIEHQLQEARRNFDNLKAKIAGFQGTLKGIYNVRPWQSKPVSEASYNQKQKNRAIFAVISKMKIW